MVAVSEGARGAEALRGEPSHLGLAVAPEHVGQDGEGSLVLGLAEGAGRHLGAARGAFVDRAGEHLAAPVRRAEGQDERRVLADALVVGGPRLGREHVHELRDRVVVGRVVEEPRRRIVARLEVEDEPPPVHLGLERRERHRARPRADRGRVLDPGLGAGPQDLAHGVHLGPAPVELRRPERIGERAVVRALEPPR